MRIPPRRPSMPGRAARPSNSIDPAHARSWGAA